VGFLKVEKQYASLDSATYMLNTMASFLKGKYAPVVLPMNEQAPVGSGFRWRRRPTNFPVDFRSRLAAWVGTTEAMKPEEIAEIDTQFVAVDIPGK
jgi:hypothetical protein